MVTSVVWIEIFSWNCPPAFQRTAWYRDSPWVSVASYVLWVTTCHPSSIEIVELALFLLVLLLVFIPHLVLFLEYLHSSVTKYSLGFSVCKLSWCFQISTPKGLFVCCFEGGFCCVTRCYWGWCWSTSQYLRKHVAISQFRNGSRCSGRRCALCGAGVCALTFLSSEGTCFWVLQTLGDVDPFCLRGGTGLSRGGLPGVRRQPGKQWPMKLRFWF